MVQYPAEMLKRRAESIGQVDDEARTLAQDLVDTMRVSPACVGLAAPQIGVGRQAFCVDVRGHRHATTTHGLVVLFDPEILEASDPGISREGCMSVPHLTADVRRASRVTVRGLTPSGGESVIEAEGFEARALLHEIDHLDGLLILDRASSPSALFPRRVYRE